MVCMSRMNRFWATCFLALSSWTFVTLPGHSQTPSNGSSGSSGSKSSNTSANANAGAQGEPGRAGGGVMADYSMLLQLIQTTVDPDNWEAGGGENSLTPFIQGVWIDADGKLHRESRNGKSKVKLNAQNAKSPVIEVPALGDLQPSENCRWISLSELDRMITERVKDGNKATPAMELLGGITRIDHVARDAKTGDWYLGGPAGDLTLDREGNLVSKKTNLPPVLLEDLLAVAPLVLNSRGPLGCSIDPMPEKLVAVRDLLTSPSAKKSLVQNTAKWTTKLADTLGEQRAIVFGLSEDSPTATALLIADEHMKRIGLGLEKGPAKLATYWDESEKRGAVPASSMIRWWFALRDDIRIGVDQSNEVYSFESPTVRVLSQKQWMDAAGNRKDVEAVDAAADAFAKGFTNNFDKLQEMYPAYGRLRHVFDLCVAMRIIRDENKDAFEMLDQASISPHSDSAIKWIPSISSWRKTTSGQVAAIISGGVSIEIEKTEIHVGAAQSTAPQVAPFSLNVKTDAKLDAKK